MKMNFFGKMAAIFIEKYKAIYLFLVIIILMGISSYSTINKEVLPKVNFPYLVISTTMIGASPEDVESLITNKIENELTNIGEVKKLTSASSQGYSQIIIQFRQGVKVADKMQKVRSSVDNVVNKLPKKADKPIISELELDDFPVLAINIVGEENRERLNDIIDTLQSKIKKVKGLNKIEVYGTKRIVLEIQPNSHMMNTLGVTEDILIQTIKNYNVNIPIGQKQLNGANYVIRMENNIDSIKELEELILLSDEGKNIILKDIATIVQKEKLSEVYSVAGKKENGENKEQRVAALFVYKNKTADVTKLNKSIKEIINEAQLEMPDEVTIGTSMDLSKYIKDSIKDVVNNAISGLLAVILVLFLFINFRESVIAAIVIPLTLLTSIAIFKLFNISLNVLSIMGLIIALGMLVDNAIVVIEKIDELKKHEASMMQTAIKTINIIAAPILSSTLTTIAAFIPLAFLGGDEGLIIRSIPIATAIAMALSFVISVTITPTLSARFIKKEAKELSGVKKILNVIFSSALVAICALYAFSNDFKFTTLSYVGAVIFTVLIIYKLSVKRKENRIIDGFRIIITKIMSSRLLKLSVVIGAITLFIISIILFGALKKEAMPRVDRQTVVAEISLDRGRTLKDTENIYHDVKKILVDHQYIDKYISNISPESINVNIQFLPKDKRTVHSKILIKELESRLSKIPGIAVKMVEEDDEEGGGTTPIVIRLFSKKTELLETEAKKVVNTLKSVKGTENVKLVKTKGLPTIEIDYDRKRVKELGLDLFAVSNQIRNLLIEEKITTIQDSDKNYEVYLKYNKKEIQSINDIKNTTFMNKKGQLIPFIEFATIIEKEGVGYIRHKNTKKMMTITADKAIQQTTVEIIKNLQYRIRENGGIATGVAIEYGGEYATMQESYKELTTKFMIAILLVFVILLLQFNSYMQPIVIIISVPFALVGVVIGYYANDLTFSTLTFLGVVSLVGIAVNDAIVLIDHVNYLRKTETITKRDSIIQSCLSRFNPVIATSVTTIVGLLPLALYNEDYSQMAYAIIFGLIASTILTLVVIPVVLSIFEDVYDFMSRMFGKEIV